MSGGARAPAGQLPLELPIEPRHGREAFLPAPSNVAALTLIDRWPDWPDPTLLVIGPPGSGKTHLCAIWSEKARARTIEPAALPSLETLTALAPSALALDDVDRVADETALFHLLNFARESGASLLMMARRAPSGETVRLPDLLSRLRRAPVAQLGAPDDELIRAVLEKLFHDRQLLVEPFVLDYAALRLERSLDAARAFVREVDREALAQGRRVSRALAGEVLERLHPA